MEYVDSSVESSPTLLECDCSLDKCWAFPVLLVTLATKDAGGGKKKSKEQKKNKKTNKNK